MPALSTRQSTRSTLWYPRSVRPLGPKISRRHGASAIINGINAIDYWRHGDDPTYLLGCMRTQISNLWELALQSDLPQDPGNNQKTAVVMLLKECRDALFGLNPLTPQAQTPFGATALPTTNQTPTLPAAQAFARPVAFTPPTAGSRRIVRTANTQSHIESNTRAALGAMAYLQDPNLFGQQGQVLYDFIHYRLQQVVALMEGSVTMGDVIAERQRLMAQQWAQEPQVTTAPLAVQYQTSALPQTTSTSEADQASVPSPVSGLQPQTQLWGGAPNTTANGQETVGSGQDWFSTYGTTVEKFADRCANWMRQNGGGQTALIAHLAANGVPGNVIGQMLSYV